MAQGSGMSDHNIPHGNNCWGEDSRRRKHLYDDVQRELKRRTAMTKIYLVLLIIPVVVITLAFLIPDTDFNLEKTKRVEENAENTAKKVNKTNDMLVSISEKAEKTAKKVKETNDMLISLSEKAANAEEISKRLKGATEILEYADETVQTFEELRRSAEHSAERAEAAVLKADSSTETTRREVEELKELLRSVKINVKENRKKLDAMERDLTMFERTNKEWTTALEDKIVGIAGKFESRTATAKLSLDYYRSYAITEREETTLQGTDLTIAAGRFTRGTLMNVSFREKQKAIPYFLADTGEQQLKGPVTVPGEIRLCTEKNEFRIVFKNVLKRWWGAKDFIEVDVFREKMDEKKDRKIEPEH
jgi:hypothetical protein